MPLSVGQSMPNVTLNAVSHDGDEAIETGDLFAGKKVLLLAMVGAFTGTCNNDHLPGYIERAVELKAKGVDLIAVLTANDVHVMKVWHQQSGSPKDIVFLADGSLAFTKAVDMVLDGTAFGIGMRTKRYAALVENGAVTKLIVEENPGVVATTDVSSMLAMLDEQ
ncbi:MAG: peroxiredoxin [Rhizobiales bacterium]|nr:peroxiredoxin [Hyphomicrobiales bacterium]MBO6698072.1 peroxiredoxin [Hyphomicrobiales bacterium]MBO6735674.1 peroxiredoxin [Hyphomicrobiales bacterium]MBO6910518.1 peroxiredoxin [Hyphomicrobiales bacterium]MBO6956131.1 peroxiredoxin [Hyphomicrobiales bacterium]